MNEVQKIGIVGDGQLGRMLTEAAQPMGFEVGVLGMGGLNSPAAQVGARQFDGALTDPEAILELARWADVTTIEIEHVNVEALRIAKEQLGKTVYPDPGSLATIQDKYSQSLHFEKHDLPVAPFDYLDGTRDLEAARNEWGVTNLIAKTRRGGYDGRGNLVITSTMSYEDIARHFDPDAGMPSLYVEQGISLQRELAVIGARDTAGRVAVYPLVETHHVDSICHTVFAPADIDPKFASAAEDLGRAAIETFEGAGVFAVEMFQDTDDHIMINEVAPRVHNSGHFSIEGSLTSQFEQHIRAITGMELGLTYMQGPGKAVMINILDNHRGVFDPAELEPLSSRNAHIHWYGKAMRDQPTPRKLGHVTVMASDLEAAHMRAKAISSKVNELLENARV